MQPPVILLARSLFKVPAAQKGVMSVKCGKLEVSKPSRYHRNRLVEWETTVFEPRLVEGIALGQN